MDEASSRFVDHLVTQKLVSEKLSKVRHQPTLPLPALSSEPEADTIDGATQVIEHEVLADNRYRLKSAIECLHEEDRWIFLVGHPVGSPRGVILLVHGLFEDNRDIYGFLVGELNRLGYSVYLTTLPFHYERRPNTSAFSGEFFFSADLGRTRNAFRRATLEIGQAYRWLKQRHSLPTYVVGFSMGGAVSLSAASKFAQLDGICLVNPATVLSEIIWTSPLCTTIKSDLFAAGLSPLEVDPFLDTFDPTLLPECSVSKERTLLICGLFDQVTQPHHYDRLVNHFKLPHVLRYKAGHLNVLRVPRLADDIARFFDRCAQKQTESAHRGPT
jgi:pimeloyl-ACP methyl ester carboxylesterase